MVIDVATGVTTRHGRHGAAGDTVPTGEADGRKTKGATARPGTVGVEHARRGGTSTGSHFSFPHGFLK